MTCQQQFFTNSAFVRMGIASIVVTGFLLGLAAFRHPVSSPLDPLAGLEIKRQLLAGSDALLERGVIPPNRPDWIMMDCSRKSRESSASNRLRQAVCEVSGIDQAGINQD